MLSTLARITIAAGAFGFACFGQEEDNLLARKLEQLRGLHIYGVSVYVGASTSAYPQGGLSLNNSSDLRNLGGDVSYGGGVDLGWQHHTVKTNLSVAYSGGYGGMLRYSDVNGFTHSVTLHASRQFTPRWTGSVSGNALENTIAQYLFQPQHISTVVQAPSTFEDFAAALQVGQFSNAAIASMLTGAPLLESPAQSMLLGNHIFSYSGQSNLSYAYSSRLVFHLSGISAAGQTRSNDSTLQSTNYVLPRSTTLTAGAGFSYNLSPRTEIGFDGSEFELWNRFQRARGVNTSASLGRKMGQRWFMRVYAGASNTQSLRAGVIPPGSQVIGGGSLGWRGYAQTVAATYDRGSYDTFGFAAGTNTTITAAWKRQRPGSRWTTFAAFAQQQMRNTGFASLSAWRASGGISMQLQRQVGVTLDYSHIRSVGTYAGQFNEFTADSVRLSFGWMPASLAR